MDLSLWGMFGVIGVMAINQLVMRVAGLRGLPVVFYSLQLLNILTGALLLWFGLPGFEDMPMVGWMIGLLLFFRVVQNNSARATWLRERDDDKDVDKRRQKVAEALRRGE